MKCVEEEDALIRVEESSPKVPGLSLASCVAQTGGSIGYILSLGATAVTFYTQSSLVENDAGEMVRQFSSAGGWIVFVGLLVVGQPSQTLPDQWVLSSMLSWIDSPIARGAKPLGARVSVTPRITYKKTAVSTISISRAESIEKPIGEASP